MRRILLFLLFCQLAIAVPWLAVGMAGNEFDRSRTAFSCKHLKGLNRRQIRFCRKNPDVMESVRLGALSSYAECQYQFFKRRWNCTLIDPITYRVVGDVLLREGTRESAFVHAISAAGIAYRVTRDCSKGLSERCGCDETYTNPREPKRGGYDYQGCSDNVQYGIGISREFADTFDKKLNATKLALVDNHNNRAGRQVLEKSVQRQCKCHGMSGSCEMKTCWDALPSFRKIGTEIKDKFDGASEVRVEEEEELARIVMKHSQFKRHTSADLVYMTQSPDFCEADPENGIFGTHGRECNATSQGVDGCQLLCCNRGFTKKVSYVNEQCNCKFHYCCRVECDTCQVRIEKHFCL